MKEWKEISFSDFVHINPTVKLPPGQDISFVEMKDLVDGKRFCLPAIERKNGSGSRFQELDTLFARITPCLENGKIAQVKGLKNGVGLGSTEFLVFRGRVNVSDNNFVFYLSRWNDVRAHAEVNLDGTSGRQRVPKECFKELKLTLPTDLSEQSAIASVLSSLDDKIDLLHRQNATLEAMAETLFRQWFVVRRPELVEGEAKEEWEEFKVSAIADHIKINIIPSKSPSAFFHHFSLPAFDDGQNPIIEVGSSILSNKYQVLPNSILVSKLNPRFPRIWPIGSDVADDSICSTEFQVFKPKDLEMFAYLFFLLKSEDARNALIMAASGTSGSHQRVRPEDISNISFSLPHIELAKEFSIVSQSFLDKIYSNQKQIRTLITLRDTLLPKLMSGEVRVKM